MTRRNFVAILGLLVVALLASSNSSGVPTIYVQKSQTLRQFGLVENKHREHVTRCEVKNNHGVKYVLYPDAENIDNKNKIKKFSYNRFNKCKFDIYNLDDKDEGSWELNMTKTFGEKVEVDTAVYNIKVREVWQKINIFPSSKIETHSGRQVSVRLIGDFDNLKSCKLLTPSNNEYDLANGELRSAQYIRPCGFKMAITENQTGVWTLVADLKNNTAFYSTVFIKLQDNSDLKPDFIYLDLKRGENAQIVGGVNAKLCILENPHGVKFPITMGKCEHNIPSVSVMDGGLWKAHYGLNDVENLIVQQIMVRTYDINPMNSSVTWSPNGDVNVLCQVRGTKGNYCMFIRPDGRYLQMSTAVSTDKYDYYGNGMFTDGYDSIFSTVRSLDCGITIHNPTKSDYGVWKCLVGYKMDKYKESGKIIKVHPKGGLNGESLSKAESTNVIVKHNDSYNVKCTTNEELSYCWLRSPNGSVHPVFVGHDVEPPRLKYAGTGLELGDCTAKIKKATETDAGKWTCHMGVRDGPELQSSFDVILKDSHLMAIHDTVFIGQAPTHLACQPLPESNKVIESCRWLTPQGQGIHVERSHLYQTETHPSFCRLTINPEHSYTDAGEWHCYARFANTAEEGSAQIVVGYRSRGLVAFFSNAMILGLLASSTLCIFLYVMYKRKRMIAEFDEKVILEKPPKFP